MSVCPECEAPTEATGENGEYELCPECGWDGGPGEDEGRTIPQPCASCGSSEIKAAEFVRRVWHDATWDEDGILHLSGEEVQLDYEEQWHLMCGHCEE